MFTYNANSSYQNPGTLTSGTFAYYVNMAADGIHYDRTFAGTWSSYNSDPAGGYWFNFSAYGANTTPFGGFGSSWLAYYRNGQIQFNNGGPTFSKC